MSSDPTVGNEQPVTDASEAAPPGESMPEPVKAVSKLVESAWKLHVKRWRRITRIQFGRCLLRASLLLRNPKQLKAGLVNAYQQIRRRPVTTATTAVGLLIGGFFLLPTNEPQTQESTTSDKTTVALDDVRIFPPDHASGKTAIPPKPSQPQGKSAGYVSPSPFKNVAKSQSERSRSNAGPRLLGPQFSGNARAVAPANPPTGIRSNSPPQPSRAVWFTGTVEDPDAERDGDRVRAANHRESSPRIAISNGTTYPPRRLRR